MRLKNYRDLGIVTREKREYKITMGLTSNQKETFVKLAQAHGIEPSVWCALVIEQAIKEGAVERLPWRQSGDAHSYRLAESIKQDGGHDT